jgi:sortase A
LRWVVGTFGEVLITLGVLVLLFVAWQLWWTDVTANREQAIAVQTLERGFEHATGGGGATSKLATPTRVPLGDGFAIMRVPRFGASFARPVIQGTDHETLTKGLGHYVGSAMPGALGNFAVAGHRTTYGRPFSTIDKLRKGDVIVIETKTSYIVYAVDRHVIVTPGRVDVISPVPQHPGVTPTESWMTLTACHPMYSARERYVVFAKLLKTIPRANGLPASVMAIPAAAS